MAEIKTLLDEVIETEISNLKTLPVEDERRGDAIRDLVSLHKLRIEEIRLGLTWRRNLNGGKWTADSARRNLPLRMPTGPARRKIRRVSFGSRRSTGMCGRVLQPRN